MVTRKSGLFFFIIMNQGISDVMDSIVKKFEDVYDPLGFEFQPFKVGWYNDFVQPTFKLANHEDTVAFLIISSPRMFERAFIPFLRIKSNNLNGIKDPIDECMQFYLSRIPEMFPDQSVKVVYDFELHPNRRPKIIMQCAAHASGAAYLYHPSNISLTNLNEQKKKLLGVCIHPKYGGWFALRAVVFFENVQCPKLKQVHPIDLIPSDEDKVKLLEMFNYNWMDWKYRDVIPVSERYSDLQKKYFTAPPGSRKEVIEEILHISSVIS